MSPSASSAAPDSDWHNVSAYGAKGDGSADDTAAIAAAISAVGPGGGVVYFPAGVYVTSAPLVIKQGGTVLMGAGPMATQGGGGSGSGAFRPGKAGGITGTKLFGSVIEPSATWAQGDAKAPAAILIDASAAEVDKVAIERMWVCGANAGTTTIHGIAAYGRANAVCIRGCGVLVLYSASSNGIYMMPSTAADPVGAIEPDGTFIDQCLCQFIGGDGIKGSFGDATITRCHTQIVGGGGYVLAVTVSAGGNIRVSDCRADLGTNGFVTDVSCGRFLGMVQFSNCSTQRNTNNGFYIQNPRHQKACPVYLANCVAQGDGTSGSAGAGYRISGPCAVTMSNCACHVDTVDVAAGAPPYGVVTTSGGVSAPVLVQILGGFMNAVSAWASQVSPPLAADIRVFAHSGGQWNYTETPALETSL
jgi:hypothetical protein